MFIKKPFSSKTIFIKNLFIKNLFHQKPLSSKKPKPQRPKHPPLDPQWAFGLQCSTERLVETPKVGISRACVKASRAFGPRRFHTNTDYVVFARVVGLSDRKKSLMKLVFDEIGV